MNISAIIYMLVASLTIFLDSDITHSTKAALVRVDSRLQKHKYINWQGVRSHASTPQRCI